MFDVEKSRVDFAVRYGADAGLVSPKKKENIEALAFAQDYATQIIAEHDLGHGFDVAVEASGAEVCTQMAVCMLKNGGTCKLSHDWILCSTHFNDVLGIQAGLGRPLTSVPLFLLTARELNIKGRSTYAVLP